MEVTGDLLTGFAATNPPPLGISRTHKAVCLLPGTREREGGRWEKERGKKKEEKMKRGEIAKGNEKNFTAQFLLLPDPIIRFCI